MTYKPDRPVTSEKIKELIMKKFPEKFGRQAMTSEKTWKRTFRQSLPCSGNQMRGFTGHGYANHRSYTYAAIAVSTDDDSKLLKVYFLEGAWESSSQAKIAVAEEAKKLAVLEVIFAED